MKTKIEYHVKDTCNKCGSRNQITVKGKENQITVKDQENGVIYECETTCISCGFRDYWAHGFFQSMQDGYNKCDKY